MVAYLVWAREVVGSIPIVLKKNFLEKTCRLMVRYAAHNGYDVGSNPTGYIYFINKNK